MSLLPSEVLSKAADLIEPEGAWTQGQYGAFDEEAHAYTCLCLFGAVKEAGDETDAADGVWKFLQAATSNKPIDWNDQPGRTQAEVVAALRQASELAKAEGQ
jgi:hypothetical protein